MTRATAILLLGLFFALSNSTRAVPNSGAALVLFPHNALIQGANSHTKPGPVRFRDQKGRGLLTQAWVNGRGPFTAALDTGAGMTIISDAVARNARLTVTNGRTTLIAGLSGREVTAQHASINQLALGDQSNFLPATLNVAVTSTLPNGVDIVIDPTQAYSPLGFVLDLPQHVLLALDPRGEGLNRDRVPAGGTLVPWVRESGSLRPFVRLSDGRLALIDTGSNFGLAISATLVNKPARPGSSRDLGGGSFGSTRVPPSTVTIGSLVLNGVPTDILTGVDERAPVILGRDALYPFRISFDPLRRLIEIAPSLHDQ